MTDFLQVIAAYKQKEIAELIPLMPQMQSEMNLLKRMPKNMQQALSQPGLSIIGEIKRASPSKGDLADIPDPIALQDIYVNAGVSALSVLTEDKYFKGSLQDLTEVVEAVEDKNIPVLRKDFIYHEAQIIQSYLAGADVILLIVASVQEDLARLLAFATDLGLHVIVEVHDKCELDLALEAGAKIIGVNNRNLKTLTTDLRTSEELISLIPNNVVKISESGIRTAEECQKLSQLGYDAILVGESLVKSSDPARLIQQMRGEHHGS